VDKPFNRAASDSSEIRSHPVHVARPWSEANPVEDVDDRLVVVGWCGCAVQSSLDTDGGDQRGGGQKGAFQAIHMSIRHTPPRGR
jgi:hypothetical protein